jgi:hypothetical protein
MLFDTFMSKAGVYIMLKPFYHSNSVQGMVCRQVIQGQRNVMYALSCAPTQDKTFCNVSMRKAKQEVRNIYVYMYMYKQNINQRLRSKLLLLSAFQGSEISSSIALVVVQVASSISALYVYMYVLVTIQLCQTHLSTEPSD